MQITTLTLQKIPMFKLYLKNLLIIHTCLMLLFNRSLLSIIELDLLKHDANNTFLRFSDINNVSCSYELDYSKSECAQFILNFNAKATKFNA